jgi:hypothetical protein
MFFSKMEFKSAINPPLKEFKLRIKHGKREKHGKTGAL